MKDFDIAKYLREHQLGSYGILNHYVDLKPLKEEGTHPLYEDFKTAAEEAIKSYDREEEKLFQSAAYQQLKDDFPNEVKKIEALATDESGKYADMGDSRRAVIEDYLEGKLDLSSMNENAYEGPEHKLTGNGKGDEFEQAETVSEEYDDDMDYDRIMDIGGNSIEQAIIRLMDSGFPAEDVLELCKSFIEDQYGAKASGMQFEETFSEGGTNRLDFPAMKKTIQSIVDDLVDDGFPVEKVEQDLKDLISNAVAPYKQKKIVNR